MSKPATHTIEVVIPDSGPLISLSRADALDVLLVFKDAVRLVITDFVEFEVTRFRDIYPDAHRICDFLRDNAGRVEIQETGYGKAMKQMFLLREKYDQDENFRNAMKAMNAEPPELPKDAGELSIVSYANELIQNPPGIPVLILAEDDFFLHSGTATPGNAHILSTHAFLETLQTLGMVPDANKIWERIKQEKTSVNDAVVDRSAAKLQTDWTGAVDTKNTGRAQGRRRPSAKERGLGGRTR